ncbi:MAG: hypothetical protein ACU0B5_06150 [Roseovarius sp.]
MIEEPPKLQIRKTIRRPGARQIAAFRDIPTGFLCDAMEGQGALCSSIQPVGGGRDLATHAYGPAIVADRDGVVVVPFARIDAVIAQLATIQELEDSLDAKVQGGLSEVPAIDDMLANGTANLVD